MKTKKLFSIFVIAMIAILMLTAVMSTVQAVDAASKVKVTWNANGGKIGISKIATTTVTKGVKVGKLPKKPTKAGYIFSGWYTKKSGGTKITATTKVKKKVTYYAQWTKTTSISKIVGNWQWEGSEYGIKDIYGDQRLSKEIMIYNLYADGRFHFFDLSGGYTPEKFEGKYSVSNGKMYIKNMKWYKLSGTTEQNIDKFGANYRKWNWGLIRESSSVMTTKYKFGSDRDGSYLEIAYPRVDADPNYIYPGEKFYKA